MNEDKAMQGHERSAEVQNVYAIRVIRMIVMGISASKSSYIDRFLHHFCLGKSHEWNETSDGTEFFIHCLNDEADQIKRGTYWKSAHSSWPQSMLFCFLACENVEFWDAIGVPMKTCKSIMYTH